MKAQSRQTKLQDRLENQGWNPCLNCGRMTPYEFCGQSCYNQSEADRLNIRVVETLTAPLTTEQALERLWDIYPGQMSCEHGGMTCHCCYTTTEKSVTANTLSYYSSECSGFSNSDSCYKEEHHLTITCSDGICLVKAEFHGCNDGNASGNGQPLPDMEMVRRALTVSKIKREKFFLDGRFGHYRQDITARKECQRALYFSNCPMAVVVGEKFTSGFFSYLFPWWEFIGNPWV